MAAQRRFRLGDGVVTILPDEVVLLDYICRNCGRVYEIAIKGGAGPTPIDCNEARICEACEKKALVVTLLERGTSVPEERLLTMTLDELQALAASE